LLLTTRDAFLEIFAAPISAESAQKIEVLPLVLVLLDILDQQSILSEIEEEGGASTDHVPSN